MSKKIELSAEAQVAENATLAIAEAMTAQTASQIAIGRMFAQAVANDYPKLLGYETVKEYALRRFDWAYSTIAQFVQVAKLGELVGWTDEELMTIGVKGKCISGLMMIGAAVKREPSATKIERANKLLKGSVGKSLNHIQGLCDKNNLVGRDGKDVERANRRKNGAAGGGDGTSNEGAETKETTLAITGDTAQRFLSYMAAQGVGSSQSAINGFFEDMLDTLEGATNDGTDGDITIPVIMEAMESPAMKRKMAKAAAAGAVN